MNDSKLKSCHSCNSRLRFNSTRVYIWLKTISHCIVKNSLKKIAFSICATKIQWSHLFQEKCNLKCEKNVLWRFWNIFKIVYKTSVLEINCKIKEQYIVDLDHSTANKNTYIWIYFSALKASKKVLPIRFGYMLSCKTLLANSILKLFCYFRELW